MYPTEYGFKKTARSRVQYQRRFLSSLGKYHTRPRRETFDSTSNRFLVSGSNFLLLVSQLLLGFALAEIFGIDLTEQKATNTCVKIVLLLIPLYLLALGLLLIFYKWFHVWKKEDVSVGFVYDEDQEVEDDPARRRFVGCWTNHMAEADAGSLSEGDKVNI